MSRPGAGATQRVLRVCWFGERPLQYAAALELQNALAKQVGAGLLPDTLVQLQHPPVYTIGKRGSSQDFRVDKDRLAATGAQVFTVPRGGQTTFHGPGQLVAYPVVNLRRLGLGARAYVEGLEDCMVRTAGAFGISARAPRTHGGVGGRPQNRGSRGADITGRDNTWHSAEC